MSTEANQDDAVAGGLQLDPVRGCATGTFEQPTGTCGTRNVRHSPFTELHTRVYLIQVCRASRTHWHAQTTKIEQS